MKTKYLIVIFLLVAIGTNSKAQKVLYLKFVENKELGMAKVSEGIEWYYAISLDYSSYYYCFKPLKESKIFSRSKFRKIDQVKDINWFKQIGKFRYEYIKKYKKVYIIEELRGDSMRVTKVMPFEAID